MNLRILNSIIRKFLSKTRLTWKKIYLTIDKFKQKAYNIKILNIKSNLIIDKISRTKIIINVDVEFIHNLNDEYFITRIFNKCLYLLNKVSYID